MKWLIHDNDDPKFSEKEICMSKSIFCNCIYKLIIFRPLFLCHKNAWKLQYHTLFYLHICAFLCKNKLSNIH